MPRRFYFAWVDKTETTFGPTHYRDDEDVFSFTLTHEEGSFASIDLEILNPKEGLLKNTRERYAWFSCVTDAGVTTPICFGRLVGIPKDISKEACTITLVCRPPDYSEQKHELASSLKVLPYYDRLFVPYALRDDLDHVLEARSAMWHCDRITGEVTASDIGIGEDGTINLGSDKLFYEDLSVSYSQAPLNKVIVNARVEWAQAGTGTIDISKPVLDAFAAGQTNTLTDILGQHVGFNGVALLLGAKGMVDAWPKTGQSIGGGWQVGNSSLQYVGTRQNGDILVGPAGIESLPEADASGVFTGAGIEVQLEKEPDTFNMDTRTGETSYQEGTATIIWIPIVPVAPHMEVVYEANRARAETFTVSVVTDTQELCADFNLGTSEGDETTLIVDVGTAKADDAKDPPEGSETEITPSNTTPIVDSRRASYFKTDRGLQSIEYLMLLARAHLISRARAVEVRAAFPFDDGLTLSCRKNAIINDYRLPNGVASGKITRYTLSYDGSSGTGQSELSIGCMIGQGGSPISPAAGTNTYAEDGYSTDYEVTWGTSTSLASMDATWNKYVITNQLVDDDGLVLENFDVYSAVKSCTVTGGLTAQTSGAKGGITGYQKSIWTRNALVPVYEKAEDIRTTIDGIETNLSIELANVVDKAFTTSFNLGTVEIKIPKGIDLEA